MGAEIATIDNRKIMTYRTGDGRLFRLGSLYYDNYYEKIWAKARLSTFRHGKYLVFGLGSGSFLRELLSQADEDAVIIVYEPDDSIYGIAASEFGAEELLSDKRIIFSRQGSYDKLLSIMSSSVHFADTKGCSICIHPNYPALFPDQLKMFRSCAGDCALKNSMIAGTAQEIGARVINNIFRNLKVFNKNQSIEQLKTVVPTGIPLVLIASGPSLDASIDVLKRMKGKAFLLSVDSALPTLMKHDIIPDIFISVDPVKELGNFTDERTAAIPGIFPFSCNNRIFEFHRAPAFFYSNSDPITDYLAYKKGASIPRLSAESSVSNHAFDAGVYLGFKNIIFIGLDLGYPGGMAHSKDALLGGGITDANDIIVETACTSGGTVSTNAQMDIYRKLLEESISSHPDINVINTSRNGALIKGSIYMSPDDAADKFCTDEFSLNFSDFTAAGYNLRKFFTEVTDSQNSFRRSLRAVLDRIKSLNPATMEQGAGTDLIPACDSLYQAIGSRPDLVCIATAAMENNIDIQKNLYEKTDAGETLQKYIKYFSSILDACDYVINLEKELFLQ